ncbi:hypothetical protein IMSAGC017_02107 [Thomasclavelia cocleata]|uniref:DUF5050 domain-containing protein n=1 Tax=Thomasclavelia cocleata TaxID=69824 RepID=A0A829ZCA4_9FIRM|nr:hypothetical protein [Thomasclavelia cocleata]GFI42061.1 hypothetical protein IMSAGC017_02107 [Thomasclavelia cocleata]
MQHRLKKIIILIVLNIVFISGCSTNTDSPGENNVQVYEQFGALEFSTDDGFYHTNNSGYLYFFDYETKKDVLTCSKVNCRMEAQLKEDSEAYIGNNGAGFVSGDKLYVISKNDDIEKKYSLIESDLDRSNQKEIVKINSTMILSFAVIKETAYFAIDEVIFTESESGAIVEEPKHNCYLLGVDLKSGKQERLTEPKNNFNNSLKIVAADENMIYMTYNYFENYFDGTNFKDANEKIENYEYDIKTKKLTSVLEDRNIVKGQLIGDTLLTVESKYINEKEVNSEKLFTVMKYTLPDYKPIEIVSTRQYPIFNNDEWIYQDDKTKEFYSLDFETVESKKIIMNGAKGVIIFNDAKDYYYISYMKDGKMERGFILKSDYKKGKKEIIEVH